MDYPINISRLGGSVSARNNFASPISAPPQATGLPVPLERVDFTLNDAVTSTWPKNVGPGGVIPKTSWLSGIPPSSETSLNVTSESKFNASPVNITAPGVTVSKFEIVESETTHFQGGAVFPLLSWGDETKTANTLSGWLDVRARKVLTSEDLDRISSDVKPLCDLIGGSLDKKKWNAETWRAFQMSSSCSPDLLKNLAEKIETGQGHASDVPLGLQVSLVDPAVDQATLAKLMRVRAFASEIVDTELPTLMAGERSKYLEVIHDRGYAAEQIKRSQDSKSILCAAGPNSLLNSTQLECLPPEVASRFSSDSRKRATSLSEAMPKLHLDDFFTQPKCDDQATQAALKFLEASGKDTQSPCPELGDKSMATFLKPVGGESRSQWLSRLHGKQIFNPLGRPWRELQADLNKLEAQGGAVGKLRRELEEKQSPALAPTLLMLKAPSLQEQAGQNSTMDNLMQVFWRATNPQLPFSDPLISSTLPQLQSTHKEQLSKDRELWTGVLQSGKTAIVAGLTDENYGGRISTLNLKTASDAPSDHLESGLGRLERDLGADSVSFKKIAEATKKGEYDLQKLHDLRFDPTSFAVKAPDSGGFTFGGLNFQVEPKSGNWVPEFVSATTVAYKVEVGPEQKPCLLRLPKGSRPQFDSNNQMSLQVFDRERFADVATRLRDYEVMDVRVPLTKRELVTTGGAFAVLEERGTSENAEKALQNGAPLTKKDAQGLLSQWLSGLAESDPTSRPFGVFYELGPDNYVIDKNGVSGSYVDVAIPFRTQRERSQFGFVAGGYGSAVNWVLADNRPLNDSQVQEAWQGHGLSEAQEQRRRTFLEAMKEMAQPSNAVWTTLPVDKRAQLRTDFIADLQRIGVQ